MKVTYTYQEAIEILKNSQDFPEYTQIEIEGFDAGKVEVEPVYEPAGKYGEWINVPTGWKENVCPYYESSRNLSTIQIERHNGTTEFGYWYDWSTSWAQEGLPTSIKRFRTINY